MLSVQEKIEIVLMCGESTPHRQVAEDFNIRHPGKNIQQSTVSRILTKFKSTGSVLTDFKKPHQPSKNIEEVQLNVCLDVVQHGKSSISQISRRTNVSESSVLRILRKNRFKPFKPKFINTLKERDFDVRYGFSAWYQGECDEDYRFPYKILWTDEATFTSNGTVSSQNCRWWSQENPNFIIECRDQYSFKTNVFCGILNNQVIGPYFFRENLNAARFLNFLRNELSEVVDNMPLQIIQDLWFQLDGAPAHNSTEVRNFLGEMFRGKIIGNNWEHHWPPRSPDLTPLDFFMWGYLKQQVYKHRPFNDIDHLEQTIRECVANIHPQFIRNAVKDVHRRTMLCIEREGRHTEM